MGPFGKLASLVEASTAIQPDGRRAAIVASLRQVDAWDERKEAPLGAIGRAYERLSEPRATDDPRIAARRKTCAELAEIALGAAEGQDSFYARAAWSDAHNGAFAAAALAPPGPEKDRLLAIQATAAREGKELIEPVRPAGMRTTYCVQSADSSREGLSSREEAVALATAEAERTGESARVYTDTTRPSHTVRGRAVWGTYRELAIEAHPRPIQDPDDGAPFGPLRRS